MRAATALITATGLMLSVQGCVSTGDLQPTGRLLDDSAIQAGATLGSAATAANQFPADEWWRLFEDPQLTRLIEEALQSSPTLPAARARVDQARAAWMQLQDDRGLQLALNASVTRTTFDGSYDFDIWQRTTHQLINAELSMQAAQVDLAAARLALTTAVSQAYFEYEQQLAIRSVAQANLQQKGHLHELTQARYERGLDSAAAVKQTESQLATARYLDESTRLNVKLAQQAIAALIGKGPDATLNLSAPTLVDVQGGAIPSRLPLDLVARRPDVVAARLRIEASGSAIAAARAAAFPNINLRAFAGLQSVRIEDLLNSGSLIAGVGPALHLPIFNAGEVRGGVLASVAQFDAAVADYNEAVIRGVREVADELMRLDSLERQRREQQVARTTAEEAYRISELRYEHGIDTLLEVLTAQTSVLIQRFSGARLATENRAARVRLIRALGGGFNPDES
jgi:NodT family efflux transporter outer membrane factor (OMF) lipoprotein